MMPVLTLQPLAAILFTAGNKSVRDWSLGKQRLKPLIAVFLCATFSASYYVGLGEAVARLAGSFVPVDQPHLVRHHDWSHFAGTPTYIGLSA